MKIKIIKLHYLKGLNIYYNIIYYKRIFKFKY